MDNGTSSDKIPLVSIMNHEAADLRLVIAARDAEIERLTADRDNSNRLLDECRHERNVLQRICAERSDEIDRLRGLLRHADDVVIWEHTPARSGFQEEIEAALGIGGDEQRASKPDLDEQMDPRHREET